MEVGWDYLSGGGGDPPRCPSLSPGNRPFTPPFSALTHQQVTHSSISKSWVFRVFVCAHAPDLLVFYFLCVVATHFRFIGRESNKVKDSKMYYFTQGTRKEKEPLLTAQDLQIFLSNPITPLPFCHSLFSHLPTPFVFCTHLPSPQL